MDRAVRWIIFNVIIYIYRDAKALQEKTAKKAAGAAAAAGGSGGNTTKK